MGTKATNRFSTESRPQGPTHFIQGTILEVR